LLIGSATASGSATGTEATALGFVCSWLTGAATLQDSE